MKAIVKCLVCLLICSFYGMSREPLQFRLNLIGNDTIVFSKLKFGFHQDATSGLDTSLGELDLPPMVPPSGYKLYGVFIFLDSLQKSNIWSYIDFRPFPINSMDTVKFLLYAIREFGIKLRISWQEIGDEVRSAWLVDEYLGTLVQVDMKKNRYVDIRNEFLDKFIIKIVLSDVNSIETNSLNNLTVWFDNNSDQIIFKNNINKPESYRLMNVFGEIILEGKINEEDRINARGLANGLYFLEFRYFDGTKDIKKVIVY
ncbi:MAG: T9SS type A sorting domain-containing protein [Ignavibacteria bacterium]|nr:T9SS type A sorting domain-containing protein [Ignavibacteria bacterium]